MKQKILGLDLGTNSIGISVRNTQKSGKITDQLEYFSSFIFPSGVGIGKSGEFSYAAQRTEARSTRRLYQSRRYRIWATLEVLTDLGFCPLSKEDLHAWCTYSKKENLFREYPADAKEFEQWVRLDFDNDGVPEYTSPYQLRAELMERQFDFGNPLERYKFGRALYHIAQRRGFKSSKGETLESQEDTANGVEVDVASELKKSEEKKAKGLKEYMGQNNCPTVGCAFYRMEQEGLRVRANEQMQAVRSMYEEEIDSIFTYQNGLSKDSELYRRIMSHKKGEGCIFYKRPLRSQKGTVGKCTLEKNKSRCPISRPEFEQFRAWSIINNLRYKTKDDSGKPSRELELSIRQQLYEEKFVRASNFKMEDILKWLKKKNSDVAELNYEDKTSVMGSPVCAKLKDILGDDWQHQTIEGYDYVELWHVCFQADEAENVKDFSITHLHADEVLCAKMIKLWGAIRPDYASLSLKAICNILRMLQEGYIYSDAVVLAKLPDVFGDNWEKVKEPILNEWISIQSTIEHSRLVAKITNNLIAEYKVLPAEDQFAFRNTDYLLDESDKKQIQKAIISNLSPKRWKQLTKQEQIDLQENVANAYQQFFKSQERNYLPIQHLTDALSSLIIDNFGDFVADNYKSKLEQGRDIFYHPSIVSIYAPQEPREVVTNRGIRQMKLLGSPATNVFRNPVVMRVLYQLRTTLNQLIADGIIDESDTSVVVETAREFNDANMRAAIAQYQRDREKENEKYKSELASYYPDRNISSTDIDKVRIWHEQGERCIYTGDIISLSNLLNDDSFEIEHTLPRSISFDDSLANKTICSAHYNRYVKKNLFPSELPEVDYQAILTRIEPWQEKIRSIKAQITLRKNKSKSATTPDMKNKAIKERHILEMELRYWQDKVSRFTIKKDDWNPGFRSNQLNDTRTITKYAYHFLRSVFGEVTVQRGEMTANFRKALGIQSMDERKDRGKHSHHAVDATMLTLIPGNTKRDQLLDLFYQREELQRRMESDASVKDALDEVSKQYTQILKSCDICGVDEVTEYIQNHILIHHCTKDQTLTPSKRRMRTRGKVVVKDGSERWVMGNSIRAQLHKGSYFGAIQSGETNANGEKEILMVARVPIDAFKSKDDIEKIVDSRVRTSVLHVVNKRMSEGMSFADALKQPIWMQDNNGQEIKMDKYGRRLQPIRHVRCKVAAGMGFLTKDKALPIREQVYTSKNTYKNYVYAQNDGNYLCLLYQGEYKGKLVRKMQFVNYFTIAQLGIRNIQELMQLPSYQTIEDGKKTYTLTAIMKTGTHVLMWKDYPEELRDMDPEQLYKRLYWVYKFNNSGSDYVFVQNHLEARSNDQIPKDETTFIPEQYQARLKLNANACNFLIEGVNFRITETGIEFL